MVIRGKVEYRGLYSSLSWINCTCKIQLTYIIIFKMNFIYLEE